MHYLKETEKHGFLVMASAQGNDLLPIDSWCFCLILCKLLKTAVLSSSYWVRMVEALWFYFTLFLLLHIFCSLFQSVCFFFLIFFAFYFLLLLICKPPRVVLELGLSKFEKKTPKYIYTYMCHIYIKMHMYCTYMYCSLLELNETIPR